MPASVFTSARDIALARRGASATLVPKSGSGPIDCLAVMAPERDEVAEFPELRGVLGAERPAWAISFSQDDVPRPVAGDRVTFAMGVTMQLRHVKADHLKLWWLCSGFIVEADGEETATFPFIYMPTGLSFATSGSLLS